MTKVELISKSNEILEDFKTQYIEAIKTVIIEGIKKYSAIKNKKDLKGSIGFYMIFCSKEPAGKKCKCSIKYEQNDYYCVYRGHSSNMNKRFESHLFYDEKNTSYPNCMKIIFDSKKYKINLELKQLFPKDGVKFPNWTWIVSRVTLPKSKKALREMFESVFDMEYSQPSFSDK